MRDGLYREAYLHYWEAYGQRPCDEYLAALRLAGRRVGEMEQARGLSAERRGDLDLAIESYALAVDYDSRSAVLEEDYARAWESREGLAALERELDLARSGSSPLGAWAEPAAVRELALREPLPVRREPELRDAVLRAAQVVLAPLRAATFDAPLSEDREELSRLMARWHGTLCEMASQVLEEEDGLFSAVVEDRELASRGVCREVLGPFLLEAETGLRIVETALRAIDRYEEGLLLERDRDLPGAAGAYLLASTGHPGHQAARKGRIRVLHRFAQESYQAALLAARERDWRSVLSHAGALLRHLPEHTGASELVGVAKHELSERFVLEARRFEDSGLPSNALVRYYLALELTGGPAVEDAVRRLERVLAGPVRRRPRVRVRPVDADERRMQRDLWRVGDEVLTRLERDMEAATQERLDALLGAPHGQPPGGDGSVFEVFVEDVDFTYPLGEVSQGVEKARYVESFQLVPNPAFSAARRAAREAQEALERATLSEMAAPRHKKALAREITSLARASRVQAEARLASLAPDVPDLRWGEVAYTTTELRLRVDVAARYRLDGESRWVSVSLESVDRIVRADPGRNIAPDPEEILSRAEALRILAPRLGDAIARDAGRQIVSRQERLYREGVARLEAHSFDVATENLVPFLYARKDHCDPLFQDAARRLKGLTGCDLPEAWGRTASRLSPDRQ